MRLARGLNAGGDLLPRIEIQETMTNASTTPRDPLARGPEISAKSWLTEAPLRMLMNNLDRTSPRNRRTGVYGGIGRAARDGRASTHCTVAPHTRSGRDLLVQRASRSDFPHACGRAARADRQLQPRTALGTWDHFHELDRKGLMRYAR